MSPSTVEVNKIMLVLLSLILHDYGQNFKITLFKTLQYILIEIFCSGLMVTQGVRLQSGGGGHGAGSL